MILADLSASPATTAACLTAGAVLVSAGSAKVRHPDPVVRALHRLRLGVGRGAGVGLGALEVVAGAVVLAVGGTVGAAAVLVAYLAFAAVAGAQLRAAGQADCGCFGDAEAPLGPSHVVVNLALAAGGAAGLVRPPASVPEAVAEQPVAGLALAVLVVVAATLVRAVLTSLPALAAERRTAVATR